MEIHEVLKISLGRGQVDPAESGGKRLKISELVPITICSFFTPKFILLTIFFYFL